MGTPIIEATKVTINNREYICKNFSEIWELFGWTNETKEEDEAKTGVIRALFINGYIELPTKCKPISLEIIPVGGKHV